jgi:hypothetical protein
VNAPELIAKDHYMKHMLESLGANFGFQRVILMGGIPPSEGRPDCR